MNIRIKEIPSATWQLEDDTFICLHDEGVHSETVEVDTMRNGEHDTYEVQVAVCEDPDCDATIEDYEFDNELDYEREED